MNKFHQGDIIIVDFEPSKGHEIKKRRPALVISRDEYNRSSPLVIVCPITSTTKSRPFLVSLNRSFEDEGLTKPSKVNTGQIFTLDVSPSGNRNAKLIGKLPKRQFLIIAQYILNVFNFNL